MTADFGFTNTTVAGEAMSLTDIKPVTNYALDKETASATALTNKAMNGVDRSEILVYKSQPIAKINTELKTNYPCPIEDGVQYGVRLDDMLRTYKDDGTPLFDTPISVSVTIRHQMVSGLTPEHVDTMVQRAIGALYYSDHETRYVDLMRGATRPTED